MHHIGLDNAVGLLGDDDPIVLHPGDVEDGDPSRCPVVETVPLDRFYLP